MPLLRSCIAAAVAACVLSTSASFAGDQLIDELRIGGSGSISSGDKHESGIFPSATIFFDPLSSGETKSWQQSFLEPRIYLGTSIATGDGASQIFGGFAWTADVTDKLFVEIGLGGTVHDGDLDSGSNGPKLGCRLLFREQVAIGYRVTQKWQIMATADHASHANLCDGPNDGLSHAGLAIGYKF